MSVINQVLSQLEQRGVQGSTESIRPIPVIRHERNIPWGIIAAVVSSILFGLGLGWWFGHRQPATIETPRPKVTQQTVAPASQNAISAIVSPTFIPLSPASLPPQPIAPKQAVVEPPRPVEQRVEVIPPPPIQAVVVTKPLAPAKPKRPAIPAFVTFAASAVPLTPPPSPVAEKPLSEVPSRLPAPLPVKQVSAAQQADAEFHKAMNAMQQGRVTEALTGFENTLSLDAGHEAARQTLVALLLENKRNGDAERVLQDSMKRKPEHTAFAMLLARLQIERGALSDAVATLEKSLPYAESQADYQAFLAALQQRQGRHADAISHYQIALQQKPSNGIWLMGMGISLQAALRPIEAKEAYQRALNSQTLTPELQSFVQQRIRGM